MTPASRVRALLRAAAKIADPSHHLGQEARERLPATTGLSAAGVELGLTRLETSAKDEEIDDLVAFAARRPADNVHVVPPANVFIALSRAVAIALAMTENVTIKPSRREPVFPDLLVRALAEEGVSVRSRASLDVGPEDRVFAQGSDATMRALAGRLGGHLVGHGSGFGLVAATPDDDAAALAEEVAVFDQRGCLSPRIVLFRGSEAEALSFAERLARGLDDLARRVPIGAVDDADRAAERAYLDAMRMVGEVVGTVAVDPSPRALVLPAGPRVLHVARVDEGADACELLLPFVPFVVTLGGRSAFADTVAAVVPEARRAAIGAMQRPPFDGPVDRRSRSTWHE